MIEQSLLEKYIEERLSVEEISQRIGCTRKTIYNYFAKYNMVPSHKLKHSDDTKICSKCKEVKIKSDFYVRKSGRIVSSCKKCCIADKNRWDSHTTAKKAFVEYKGGKCVICMYSLCLSALDFHHLDSIKKDFQIGTKNSLTDVVRKELDKCVLVCCRCHREIHAGLHQVFLESCKIHIT